LRNRETISPAAGRRAAANTRANHHTRPGTQQNGQPQRSPASNTAISTNNAPADTTKPRNTAPLSNAPKLTKTRNQWALEGLFDVDPPGVTRTVEYDLAHKYLHRLQKTGEFKLRRALSI
jgi:hypothetical protein